MRLVGVRTNRAAIGARIKITLISEGQPPRYIYRDVSTGGSFGASPLQQHIGLGKAKSIATLEIWWPASNTHQTFHNLRTNRAFEVREFEKSYRELSLRSFLLGGSRVTGDRDLSLPKTAPADEKVL